MHLLVLNGSKHNDRHFCNPGVHVSTRLLLRFFVAIVTTNVRCDEVAPQLLNECTQIDTKISHTHKPNPRHLVKVIRHPLRRHRGRVDLQEENEVQSVLLPQPPFCIHVDSHTCARAGSDLPALPTREVARDKLPQSLALRRSTFI